MNITQQCPHCGEYWWGSHVCPMHPWNKPNVPTIYPAVPNSPMAPAVKPEQVRREFSEEEIRGIIREEIAKFAQGLADSMF